MKLIQVLLLIAFLLVGSQASANPLAQDTQMAPECGTMQAFGDAMTGTALAIGMANYAILTSITPDVGLAQDDHTWLQLSWPLAYAFGWASDTAVIEQRCAEDIELPSRVNRVMLEPILRMGDIDGFQARFLLRPGYRFLYRTTGFPLGFGAGVGSTIDFESGGRASISPELVLSYGECCFPSYATLAARFDHYFETREDTFTVQVGWTFF